MIKKYLYAIILNENEKEKDCNNFLGINKSKTYLVKVGEVAVIVSDITETKLRPTRNNIKSHQGIINSLMKANIGTLPIKFGTIVNDQAEVKKFLKTNNKQLFTQLKRIENKVEMGLKVKWDTPDIFKYFVDTHPELRNARDLLFKGNTELSYEEKIDIGKKFEKTLNEDREKYTELVENILKTKCFEIKQNPLKSEREVMNLVCLIDRNLEKEFEEAIYEAATLFNDNYLFDYNGPWAPYNFVDTEINF